MAELGETEKGRGEKMPLGTVGPFSVFTLPPGWGRTHRTLCRSRAALTASTAQRRHLSFPFKGYQKAQSVAFILSSVLIQCMGITDPRHSTYRSYCSAWHM